jgi:hypothetical protein
MKKLLIIFALSLFVLSCVPSYNWKYRPEVPYEVLDRETKECLERAHMVGAPWSVLTFGWVYNLGKNEINEQCLREKGWIE